MNFTGSSSGVNGVDIAELTCSPSAVCEGITLEDIDVLVGNASGVVGTVVCSGVEGDLGGYC